MWIELAYAFAAASSAALAILGAFAAHRHAAAAREAASTARGKSSNDSRVPDLIERVEVLETLIRKLDARDKMRSVRLGSRRTDTGEPDPHTDPQGWKAHMRRRQALGGSP